MPVPEQAGRQRDTLSAPGEETEKYYEKNRLFRAPTKNAASCAY